MSTTLTLEAAGAAVADADAELISAVERWRDVMLGRLDELAETLNRHIEETEGPDGILAEVIVDSPRLCNETDRLRAEHVELGIQIAETRLTAATSDLGQDPHQVKALHLAVHQLLTLLDGHCHRSVRLLQDSVVLDIGGPVG